MTSGKRLTNGALVDGAMEIEVIGRGAATKPKAQLHA